MNKETVIWLDAIGRTEMIQAHIIDIQHHSMTQRYGVCGIICNSNIWRFALKLQLVRFLIGGFQYFVFIGPAETKPAGPVPIPQKFTFFSSMH